MKKASRLSLKARGFDESVAALGVDGSVVNRVCSVCLRLSALGHRRGYLPRPTLAPFQVRRFNSIYRAIKAL